MIKFLLDFLPIALFFVAFKFFDLMIATKVAIAASALQLIWQRLATGKVEKVNLISFLSIAILGGATLLLKDDIFVKWKPTAVYWLLGTSLLFSHLFSNKTLMQRLGEGSLNLPVNIWRKINFAWFSFFFVMGLANLYVVYNFDTKAWVNFKLFGTLGITIVFILLQSILMAKHLRPQSRNSQ